MPPTDLVGMRDRPPQPGQRPERAHPRRDHVEDHAPPRQPLGDPVQQRVHLLAAQARQQSLGQDQGGPVARDLVPPALVQGRSTDRARCLVRCAVLPAQPDDLGKVQVDPLGAGRRIDPVHPAVQAGGQVQHETTGVFDQERRGQLVDLARPRGDQRCVGPVQRQPPPRPLQPGQHAARVLVTEHRFPRPRVQGEPVQRRDRRALRPREPSRFLLSDHPDQVAIPAPRGSAVPEQPEARRSRRTGGPPEAGRKSRRGVRRTQPSGLEWNGSVPGTSWVWENSAEWLCM